MPSIAAMMAAREGLPTAAEAAAPAAAPPPPPQLPHLGSGPAGPPAPPLMRPRLPGIQGCRGDGAAEGQPALLGAAAALDALSCSSRRSAVASDASAAARALDDLALSFAAFSWAPALLCRLLSRARCCLQGAARGAGSVHTSSVPQ
jgi:hypothetical protein